MAAMASVASTLNIAGEILLVKQDIAEARAALRSETNEACKLAILQQLTPLQQQLATLLAQSQSKALYLWSNAIV